MSLCLNPSERHPNAETGHLLCQMPNCGFLIEGAAIEHWRVERLLGTMGSKKYFLASAPMTDERMVVKLLNEGGANALRTLQPLLMLRHPHIHHLWHIGQVDETDALVLLDRFEAAGSLARFTGTDQRLPLSVIAGGVLQLAQGLAHAHAQNVIHGALKPEDCLVVSSNHLRISDFYHGLIGQGTTPVGQSLYQAPEQVQGLVLAATDQYALALITLQLLSQYVGNSTRSLSLQRDGLTQVLTRLPQAVQRVLATALQPDPASRFGDVLLFARELKQALDGGGRTQASGPQEVVTGRQFPADPLRVSGEHKMQAQLSPRLRHGDPFVSAQPELPPTRLTRLNRLPGHTEAVTMVRWAHDGIHLASTGLDRSVQIWQVRQHIGTPLATLTGYQGEVTALSWLHDNSLLATAGKDAALRIWEFTLTPTFSARAAASWWGHDGPITALEWSPDGRFLASGGRDQMVRLWDSKGNELSFIQANKRGVTALAWSPDSRWLATGGSDKQVHIWDAISGQRQATYPQHNDEIGLLRWSPNGMILASSGRKKDPDIHLWNTQNAQGLGRLPVGREVVGMLWSADAKWFAAATQAGKFSTWRLDEGGIKVLPQLDLDAQPLVMDASLTQHMLALGTVEMTVILQKWNM